MAKPSPSELALESIRSVADEVLRKRIKARRAPKKEEPAKKEDCELSEDELAELEGSMEE